MKTARIAIFLTGMIGLAMGGLMSLSSIQSHQEESVLRTNESLKTQAQVYVDGFFGAIEAVRTGGNPSYVLNQYSVKIANGAPAEIESSKNDQAAANTNATAPANAPTNAKAINTVIKDVDLALEERLLRALKAQVNPSDFQFSQYSIGTYETTDVGSKEGIYIAIPSVIGASNEITKINVILIDPNLAMTSLPKLANSKLNRSAFLISKTGKVLAHTAMAYVGTDLRKTEGLRENVEGLFTGAQTGLMAGYRGVDGNRMQVAFIRAGTLPFAVGVEQRAIPSVFSWAWFEEQVNSGASRKALGMIFVVLSASLVLFTAVSFGFSRRIQRELKLSRFQSRFQSTDSSPIVNPEAALEAFSKAKNQMESEARILKQSTSVLSNLKAAAKEQPAASADSSSPVITVHRDYAEELATRLKEGMNADEIEKELTQHVSQMSESTTLFFRYNTALQNLTLGTISGNTQIANPNLLQAYIRKDIEDQVEAFAAEGKVASLNNYGPVSKMMITHLNVAHFEAWAVTSEADISGGTPKMVGVLVVLNAGFRSAQSRPVLSRMLKVAGNYLFAQKNKIKPGGRPSITPSFGAFTELNA